MAKRPRKPVNMGHSLKRRAAKQFKKPKKGNLNQFDGKRVIITGHPQDWFGDEGQVASFTVTAVSEDASPLTYQWQERIINTVHNLVDGGEFSGTNTPTLSVSGIDASDQDREFRCRVCNPHTCSNSLYAQINVTNVTYFIITEQGTPVVDEPIGANNIVDERSP